MRQLANIEEANECTAVRLTDKRQRAKVGDVFRLSPAKGVFVWGRLMKKSNFFGLDFELNLVYIYDVTGEERPAPERLIRSNLIIGPSVVNNLGFSRGYWQIIASEPVKADDLLDKHLFIRFRGTGSPDDYDLVDETGTRVRVSHSQSDRLLSQSGIGNYNLIDWQVQEILQTRGVMPQ
jgi:hypothetical protein